MERTMPYRPDRRYLLTPPSQRAVREATKNRIAKRLVLPPRNVPAIKSSIAAGQPVGVSLPIFKSTRNSLRFHSEGRFHMRLGPLDEVTGGHAMCVVSYCDNDWLSSNGFEDEVRRRMFAGKKLVGNMGNPKQNFESFRRFEWLRYCAVCIYYALWDGGNDRHTSAKSKSTNWLFVLGTSWGMLLFPSTPFQSGKPIKKKTLGQPANSIRRRLLPNWKASSYNPQNRAKNPSSCPVSYTHLTLPTILLV